jgi:hypothetical protein
MQVIPAMKTRLFLWTLCLAGSLGPGAFRATATMEVSVGVSVQATSDFYQPLAADGDWVGVGSYGRCWRPAGVRAGWRPYCNGSWEWTDAGWYWNSDEPWAWACYHYGTWIDDPNYGWVWVPGIAWAPAWVDWRMGDDYIGWAPCGPAGYGVEPSFYVFVENRHFHDRFRPDTVIVNDPVVMNKTSEIRNLARESRQLDGKSRTVFVNAGPRLDTVEKATGHKFTAVPVQTADRRTFASVPEKLKHRTDQPAGNDKSLLIPSRPNPAPDYRLTPRGNSETPNTVAPKHEVSGGKVIPPERTVPQYPRERTIPQAPRERIVPPATRELPADRQPPRPKEVVPPIQPAPHPPTPVVPPGNPVPNGNGQKKDHDHTQRAVPFQNQSAQGMEDCPSGQDAMV